MKTIKTLALILFISISYFTPICLWIYGVVIFPDLISRGEYLLILVMFLGTGGILGLISLFGPDNKNKSLYLNRKLTLFLLVSGMLAVTIPPIVISFSSGLSLAYIVIDLSEPHIWFISILPVICTLLLIYKFKSYLFDFG